MRSLMSGADQIIGTQALATAPNHIDVERPHLEATGACPFHDCPATSGPYSETTQLPESPLADQLTLELWNEIGARLGAELDLDRLVQTVTDAGVKLVGAEFGAFFYTTMDDSGQALLLYTLSGAPREAFARFDTPRRTSLFGPTFDGHVVRSDDITLDPRYGRNPPYHGMPEGHLPVRSYLAVPVVGRNEQVLGGLFFGHSQCGKFTAAAERIIVGVAAQAAIAVDNARLLQAVQFTERRFRALIENSSDCITVADARQQLIYISPSVTKVEGYASEELVSASQAIHDHPDDLSSLRDATARLLTTPGSSLPLLWRRRHKDGHWLWLEGIATNLLDDPAVRGIVTNYRDITGRIRNEEQQIRSQKMEALGTLAGGIAHDFNNILLAITGNTRLAIQDLEPQHPVQENLREVVKASQRAAELVKRILSFSRQQEPKREVTQLQPIVEEALNLLRATLPAMIEIRLDCEPGLPCVAVDAIQIHQILMNLLTNAAHAIGDRRGVIEIAIESTCITHAAENAVRDLRDGRYVRLSVSDDGCGMDQATLARIFDPFFTTKPIGQGTGLGLSVVHGIMKSHEGAQTVYSEPGRGTTLRLYFPASDAALTTCEPILPTVTPGMQERVLYIDDDDAIVLLTTRFLTRRGYRVEGFTDALAALERFRADPHGFEAVITDFSMANLSGIEVAQALRRIRADIPVLLTSGYFRPQDREAAHRCGLNELILKPGSIEELVGALDRQLKAFRTGHEACRDSTHNAQDPP